MTRSAAISQPQATVLISSNRIRSLLRNRGQAASDLEGLGSGNLSSLAGEDGEIHFEDLLVLAKHFKQPWPYLLLDVEEEWRATTHDHRTLRSMPVTAEATERLFDIVDGVFEVLEISAELGEESADLPTAPTSLADPPITVGASLRDYLGVSFEDQLANAEQYAALRLWARAVQAHGIFAFQRTMPDTGVRAFSLSVGSEAAIVTDSTDTPYARVFSMLHELVHLALRDAGLCDLDRQSRVESYCNAVAAACLLPADMLREAFRNTPFVGEPAEDDARLKRLSRRLGASQAAVLIALKDHHLADDELLDQIEARRAARLPKARDGSGGPTYYDVRISRAGSLLLGRVFDALDSRAIEAETAGAMLDVKGHQLQRLREAWTEAAHSHD